MSEQSAPHATPPKTVAAYLLGISRAAAVAPDWTSALNAVASTCVGLQGAIRCTILLWDQAHDELEVGADRSLPGAAPITTGVRVALERWPAFRETILSRVPMVVVDDDPRLSPGERKLMSGVGAASLLVIPLWQRDEALGLLLLFGRLPDAFTPAHAVLGREIGSIAAASLGNARVLERGRRIESAQAALFRVSQAAISLHDRSVLLREIVAATRDALACDACAVEIWRRDTDEIETVAFQCATERDLRELTSRRYGLSDFRNLRFALEQQTALQVHPSQYGISTAELDELRGLNAESMLIVPMTIGGDTLGALTMTSRKQRAFDRDALTFAQEIAAQTALALRNAQHVARTRRQGEEQASLLRVSRAVISGRSLRDVLDEIGRTALSLEGVDASRIWLWHPVTRQIELVTEELNPSWRSFYQRGEHYPTLEWTSMESVLHTREMRTFNVADAQLTPRERANHVADGARSLALMPITVNKEALGCLALYSSQTRRFQPDTLQFGSELAEQAAHAIDRARLYRQLRVRAETDGLTTLLNHRAAFETLDRQLAGARDNGSSVGVIVVDLDDFKLFNDTHGHLVGDRVLVEVSRVLKQTVRAGDHVARYGGDEFLVILPGANALATQTIAQEIVVEMDDATVDVDGLQLPIRCSVGVATYPRDARSRPELIAFADSSMYAAKELGGGQVGSIQRGTRSLEVSTLGALSGLVRAVDRKDRYTKDHSDLVAEYAVRFGRFLKLTPQKLEALELAGQLHDVGKIAVPDSILRKPGHLTPDEEAMIRQHVVFSELMIKGVPHLDDVLAGVGHHHERWDGRGYPYGKSGIQIPLLGRILALADALAAMTYDRPYRKGRSLQQAVEEIRKGAGTQFDPDLVEPFIAAVTSSTGLLSDAARRSTGYPGATSYDVAGGIRIGARTAAD
jgi:diguanylate cyclase (GGDEF)-like protein